MKQIVKDALILTAITLISGCLLGLVYEITKEPIAQAKYDARQKAYKEVFEEAENFEDYEAFDESAAARTVTESGYTENTINSAAVAMDASGNVLGYVITVTSHAGYGGDITFSVGITNEGVVNGYSITSISETAGLGMKAKEKKFSSQFNGKNAAAFEVVKVRQQMRIRLRQSAAQPLPQKQLPMVWMQRWLTSELFQKEAT